MAVAATFVASHAGTAPTYFPILGNLSTATYYRPKSIEIHQDEVTSNSLTELIALFLGVRSDERPSVRFRYHDRSAAIDLLEKIGGLVNVFQRFGRHERAVNLDSKASAADEILSFVINGNHLPNMTRYLSGDNSILVGWAAAKSAKSHDTRHQANLIIRETLQKIQQKISSSTEKESKFWLTLYAQLLLDLAMVTDAAPSEVNQALLIARQIDDSSLIAHCQRFANQFLGVSREALAMLNESFTRFERIPQNSPEHSIFLPSRFGAMLNRNTTMFISATNPIDAGAFEADYWEAKETLPSYANIGMLANAAAVAYLLKNQTKKAVDLLERANLENSLIMDGFNIRGNLVCAQYMNSGRFEEAEFLSLCEDIKNYDFAVNWEYQKIRIGLNLMSISRGRTLYDAAWSAIQQSEFLSDFEGDKNIDSLQRHLVNKRYRHYLVGGQIGGQFGKLTRKSQIFLCIDKDWK